MRRGHPLTRYDVRDLVARLGRTVSSGFRVPQQFLPRANVIAATGRGVRKGAGGCVKNLAALGLGFAPIRFDWDRSDPAGAVSQKEMFLKRTCFAHSQGHVPV